MKSIIAGSLLALAACSPEIKALEPLPAAPIAVAPPQKDPLLSAVGIGVSDLEKSLAFYTNVMGMKKVRSYDLADMKEEVIAYPDGESYIVLMHWKEGKRTYKDLPVKIVTRTKDPAALAAKIKAAGFELTREPAPSEQVGGAIVGLAKDPDGYVLELLPLRAPVAPPAEANGKTQ